MNKPKKLLFTAHVAGLRGGAELSLLTLVIDATRRGNDCMVVVPAEGELSKALATHSISYEIVPSIWSIKTVNDTNKTNVSDTTNILSQAMIQAYDTILKFEPDAIISYTIASPWFGYVARSLGIFTILFICEVPDERNNIILLPDDTSFFRNVNNAFDVVIFNSDFTRSIYTNKIHHSKQTLIVYPTFGIDEKYTKQSAVLKQGSPLDILVLGSVSPHKNQLEPVQAGLELKKMGIPFSMFVVGTAGNPAYYEEISRFITDNNLQEDIILSSHTSEPYETILEHDILIVPSKAEAFGRVTVEGQALGRLVVGANKGGTKEIITNKKTGLLYESGDPSDLCRLLAEIYRNPDIQLYNDIALQGQVEASMKFLTNKSLESFYEIKIPQRRKNSTDTLCFDPLLTFIHREKFMANKLVEYANALEESQIAMTDERNQKDSLSAQNKQLEEYVADLPHNKIRTFVKSKIKS